MKNVFSKRKVTHGIRMYATRDGKQRFYGKDKDYFVSTYDIEVLKDEYVLAKMYSYAVLDMYGETLSSGFCNGTVEVDTSDKRARFITVSGLSSNIGFAMIIDAPISETGDNPEYIEPEDEKDTPSPGPSPSYGEISSFLANDFTYDSDSNSYIISSMSPEVKSYEILGKEFTAYVRDIDSLKPNSSVNLFGNKFRIHHINNEPLVTLLESVASVMPFLCSKETMTARMLYSYISTSQTGLGLEDLFLDVGDEPFK